MEQKYWLTTQWPNIQEEKNKHHENVYIREGAEEVVEEMEKGDIILIYESKSGRTKRNDDNQLINMVYPGRMGIVDIVKVTSSRLEELNSKVTNYTNGTSIFWKYYKHTESELSNGFVSRLEVNKVIGYDEKYNFRGFGTQHSGIKKLTNEQGISLKSDYINSKNIK